MQPPGPQAPPISDPPVHGIAGGTKRVVAIGASAGGLEAFKRLLPTLSASDGSAYVLVQHLDADHPSLLGALLAEATEMRVQEAAHRMRVEPGQIYVIPAGSDLRVRHGAFQLSPSRIKPAPKLPFDTLLRSMAENYGAGVVAVVLSGKDEDGALGVQAVKAVGGWVIAQDPGEAAFKGMPSAAIATGMVDQVLGLEDIGQALAAAPFSTGRKSAETFDAILALLRDRTGQDFTGYKSGTLHRRIVRRMVMRSLQPTDLPLYLQHLDTDLAEAEALARDLLIHVTGFFRDLGVFDYLAASVIPDLLKTASPGRPVRVWVPACSTGEEAYSLAILFQEAVSKTDGGLVIQIFASDIDPDAIATAREGVYPLSISDVVSPARLARFFVLEPRGYRISPELRDGVVFAVHDVLADPPFAHLDLISCRNLLIYLGPEAQAAALSRFHFALRPGGMLLLGKAEAVPDASQLYDAVQKSEKLYRRSGASRGWEQGMSGGTREQGRSGAPAGSPAPTARASDWAHICREQVLANFNPPTALVSANLQCLYLTGGAERFLRMSPGRPTQDFLAMSPPGMRAKLRGAFKGAEDHGRSKTIDGVRRDDGGGAHRFRMEVRPLVRDADLVFLVYFFEQAPQRLEPSTGPAAGQAVAEMESELQATKAELSGALTDLQLANDELRSVQERAVLASENFQTANEELLASQEEQQSLNEELTALNGQLQEALERQQTAADDLQNILYSADVATLFLDLDLKIRFFTPASRRLFNILPGDVGRSLSDLASLATDPDFPNDAQEILQGGEPVEREVTTRDGTWFARRILPYRGHGDSLEGVVITFSDVTVRREAADAMEKAKQVAETANLAKTRFLAVASHDLRQPLQALTLLQGLLGKAVDSDRGRVLVGRLEDTLKSMTGMIDTLLDINQIESGSLQVNKQNFKLGDVFENLRNEFAEATREKGLELRVMACKARVQSDPRLFEQMLRNLLANALKYTFKGKILVGCRRRGDQVRVGIWDTGVGIAENELGSIFNEYHQIDNAARERSRGLGLGLSIVARLGELLGHSVQVASRPGRGSVFSIDVPIAREHAATPTAERPQAPPALGPSGRILLVEDDPDIRHLMQILLEDEGHTVLTAVDGPAAIDALAGAGAAIDMVVSDFNLPGGMDGLAVAAAVRRKLGRGLPVAIITGDISSSTLAGIARDDCVHLAKPVAPSDLLKVVGRLLVHGSSEPASGVIAPSGSKTDELVYVVDDDAGVRMAVCGVLNEAGLATCAYTDAESFLADVAPNPLACLIVDAYLPGMGGVELLDALASAGHRLPTMMMTGRSDVEIAVRAMKAGASEFLEKPIAGPALLAAVRHALEQARDASVSLAWRAEAADLIAGLTDRQREIMNRVLAGEPSKNIAADLGISQRTVENHRAMIMKKTGVRSLPALARLALAAG